MVIWSTSFRHGRSNTVSNLTTNKDVKVFFSRRVVKQIKERRREVRKCWEMFWYWWIVSRWILVGDVKLMFSYMSQFWISGFRNDKVSMQIVDIARLHFSIWLPFRYLNHASTDQFFQIILGNVFHHLFSPSLYESLRNPKVDQLSHLDFVVFWENTTIEKVSLQVIRQVIVT